MENFFCGVDISKDSLDYSICNAHTKSILLTCKVNNSIAGILKMIKHVSVKTNQNQVKYCIENTGRYGLLLAHLLQPNQLNYSIVSSLEILRSSGLIRGKTDIIDAQRIALYAATFSHKLKSAQLPGESILKIKTLLSNRKQFVGIRNQLKNAYKSMLVCSEVITLESELQVYTDEIERFTARIKEIENKISSIIKQDTALNKSFEKITNITGIGFVVAASLLMYTNNFQSFSNPRKFNCYCGLAPFEYTSGSSVRGKTRTSNLRNKELKKLLFNAANAAIRHDKQIRTYYNRKTKEGKHKLSVINAVACKLIYRVFAVANREEPYVNFSV